MDWWGIRNCTTTTNLTTFKLKMLTHPKPFS
jgi:hypothetical protein